MDCRIGAAVCWKKRSCLAFTLSCRAPTSIAAGDCETGKTDMTQDDVLRRNSAPPAHCAKATSSCPPACTRPSSCKRSSSSWNPAATERLCKALAEKITERFGKPDVVVSPAVGGIIPGYETARALGVPSIFVEREDGHVQAAPRLLRSRRARGSSWSRTSSPPASRRASASRPSRPPRRRRRRRLHRRPLRRQGRCRRAAGRAGDPRCARLPRRRSCRPSSPAIPAEEPGSRGG